MESRRSKSASARLYETEYRKEVAKDIERYWEELRGDLTDEAAEAAMKAGESLKFEEIAAQAAGSTP